MKKVSKASLCLSVDYQFVSEILLESQSSIDHVSNCIAIPTAIQFDCKQVRCTSSYMIMMIL